MLFKWANMERLDEKRALSQIRGLLHLGTYSSLAAKSRAISAGTDP